MKNERTSSKVAATASHIRNYVMAAKNAGMKSVILPIEGILSVCQSVLTQRPDRRKVKK